MAVPSTQDVIRLISDTLDIALQCLGEDHWAEARVNPEVEVGETDVSVEGYAISIDPSTGRPTARSDESKELGSPTPVVVTKPSINQGTVTSKSRYAKRFRQEAKEPLPLFRALEAFRSLLSAIPAGHPSIAVQKVLDRMAGVALEVQGADRIGMPRLASRTPPTTAYVLRQVRSENKRKFGGPGRDRRQNPQGKGRNR
jgi:hypothetical protein